jgi:hypothetical protein
LRRDSKDGRAGKNFGVVMATSFRSACDPLISG